MSASCKMQPPRTRTEPASTQHGQQILLLIVLVVLMGQSHTLGASYALLEVVFVASLLMAFWFRRQHRFKLALRCYLTNRMVGLLQPMVTLLVALTMGMSLQDHWPAYAILTLDLLLTVVSFSMFMDYFTPIQVRPARLEDLDQLVEIEVETFTETQRASREQLARRLQTHAGTCLVAEHARHGIVGSLFARSVTKQGVVSRRASHRDLTNADDFTPSGTHDALYIIGLQARHVPGLPVALFLQAALGRYAVQAGARGVLGGPRLPEYHRHSDMDLEAFVHSEHATLLRQLIENGRIPLLGGPEVVCGLRNYFPDPQSLDCAALVWWPNPFRHVPTWIRSQLSQVIYALAVVA